MFLIERGKVRREKAGLIVDELGKDHVSGMLHLFTQDPCFATLIVRWTIVPIVLAHADVTSTVRVLRAVRRGNRGLVTLRKEVSQPSRRR